MGPGVLKKLLMLFNYFNFESTLKLNKNSF
jgi:hypothetical protein